MSKEELIKHARAIKDFCMERSDCTDCPFSYDIGTGCKLTDIDDYPTRWDLPEVRVSEGHYEYGIFDNDGKLVGNIWDDGEFVKILCEERNARSIKKGYCVKKRLVMCWEADNDEDGL